MRGKRVISNILIPNKYTNIQIMSAGLVYPQESYQLIGLAFKIFNDLGYGLPEKHYQKAFAKILEDSKLQFKQEVLVQLNYLGTGIGRYFLDFVIGDKIIIELKVRPKLGYDHIRQVMGYLRSTGYQLAILIYFTRDGVKYRRVVNLPDYQKDPK